MNEQGSGSVSLSHSPATSHPFLHARLQGELKAMIGGVHPHSAALSPGRVCYTESKPQYS